MIFENWLYTGSLSIQTKYCPPLRSDIQCECLVVGGGFAGLHAALRLADAGKDVVLIEKRVCGGSSSGQSGGFLTPESEEDMAKLIQSFGAEEAKKIYDIPLSGLHLIMKNVRQYTFNCDLRKQDSLYVSIKKSHDKNVLEETKTRKQMGFPYKYYDKGALQDIHPGTGYRMGLHYPGSYGINSFAYTQEMKNVLLKKGVRIFESSEVTKIEGNTAKTHLGSVTAKNILICIDKMKTELDAEFSKKYYHVQTYLAVSEPLSSKEMKSIFPKDELMCWDTRWNYIHYRPVEGNRLLVGGSSMLTAYSLTHRHSPKVINSFIQDLKKQFPSIAHVDFTHYWCGLIDVTKDLVPIADYDQKNRSIQYALGCAGLPWAAFCGDYLARRVLEPKKTEDLSAFLGVRRKFMISDGVQKVLGKKLSFMLSHLQQLLK